MQGIYLSLIVFLEAAQFGYVSNGYSFAQWYVNYRFISGGISLSTLELTGLSVMLI